MDSSNQDRKTIRELADKVLAISSSHRFDDLRRQWKLHNDMASQQAPMVLIYPDQDGIWGELIPGDTLVCSDPFLRTIEFQLRQKIYRNTYLHDDFVIEGDVLVEIPGLYTGHHYGKHDQKQAWGLDLKHERMTDARGSYEFAPVLNTEEDYGRFFGHALDFILDGTGYSKRQEILGDVLDGTGLRVKWELPYVVLVCSLVIELVHLRGMENIYFDLYDNPELLMQVFRHMGTQKASLLDRLESKGLLILNNEDHWTGSGGVGYSQALVPPEGSVVSLSNLWGFADAQEFSDVSFEMWRSFALENQAPALRKFGYACYGCCEPMDGKYDAVFEALPNIRRISVSPWADTVEAVQQIGKRAIYSRKPNPAQVCFGFDRSSLRKELTDFVHLTRDCYTEIILKDLRSCNSDPKPLIDWVDIAMEITKGA